MVLLRFKYLARGLLFIPWILVDRPSSLGALMDWIGPRLSEVLLHHYSRVRLEG